MQFNIATLQERQRVMTLQAKFEGEYLRFEVGFDKNPP